MNLRQEDTIYVRFLSSLNKPNMLVRGPKRGEKRKQKKKKIGIFRENNKSKEGNPLSWDMRSANLKSVFHIEEANSSISVLNQL